MQRTKSQNSRFYGLVGKLKLDPDEKKEVVLAASSGRTTKSSELTEHEMQRAVDQLSGQQTSSIERMRSKARAIASDIGLLKVVDGKTDYTALDSFIQNKFKEKSLFNLDQKKLADCITALERWRFGNMKKVVKQCLNDE